MFHKILDPFLYRHIFTKIIWAGLMQDKLHLH